VAALSPQVNTTGLAQGFRLPLMCGLIAAAGMVVGGRRGESHRGRLEHRRYVVGVTEGGWSPEQRVWCLHCSIIARQFYVACLGDTRQWSFKSDSTVTGWWLAAPGRRCRGWSLAAPGRRSDRLVADSARAGVVAMSRLVGGRSLHASSGWCPL